MRDRAAADLLAATLDVRLAADRVCPACLFGVAMELEKGDERAIRSAVRFFAPLLWDEGSRSRSGQRWSGRGGA